MYKLIIFEHHAESTVKRRIEELKKQAETNKHARVLFNKINEYIEILKRNGTRAGEKYTKHIEGDIWELRPLGDRIFFFCWINNTIVLLHCFQKKSQKTPKREIEQAKRNLYLFIESEKEK